MAAGLLDFTDDSFEAEVLNADKPVLVDFWATWCGPCKALTPTVEKLAAEFDGQMVVGKLDIGSHPQTAGKFGIRGIPHIMFFKNGEVVESINGKPTEDKLRETMEKVLSD